MCLVSEVRDFQRRGAEWLKALRPHGGQTASRDGEVGSGGRHEGPAGNADVEEVGQGWRGGVMDGFDCMEEDLISQCGV